MIQYASKLQNGMIVIGKSIREEAVDYFEFDTDDVPSPPTDDEYFVNVDFETRTFSLELMNPPEPEPEPTVEDLINALLGDDEDE